MRTNHLPKAVAATASVLLTTAVLAACGSSSASPGSQSGKLSNVSVALDFIPNADNEGVFVAEKLGYFKDAGLNVTVVPYGQTPPDSLVAAGKVNFAIAGTEGDAIFDVASGDKVTSVFAVLQHDPDYYGFLASADIKSPKDFCNKTYGGFGLPFEVPTIRGMIQKAGGPANCPINVITLGSSAYQALESGKVNFSLFFFSDIIQAEEQQHAHLRWFQPRAYGIPDQYAAVFIGNNAWLNSHPTQARAFVGAIQKAYTYILKNPAQGARIEADLNPNAVFLPAAIKSSEAMAKSFLLSPNGQVGVQDLQMWENYGNFLVHSGVLTGPDGQKLTDPPDWSTFFTNKYLPTGTGSS